MRFAGQRLQRIVEKRGWRAAEAHGENQRGHQVGAAPIGDFAERPEKAVGVPALQRPQPLHHRFFRRLRPEAVRQYRGRKAAGQE